MQGADFVFLLLVLALLGTLGVLALGLVSFVRGSGGDARKSNSLMRLRVIMQGVALALFALWMLLQ